MKPCKCPLCNKTFAYGILGWDSHIARVENHPNWHPKVVNPEARKRLFQREFIEFFDLAKTAYRHKSGMMPRVQPEQRSVRKVG